MKFTHVVDVLSSIEAVNSRNKIMEMLAELFSQATPEEAQILSYLCLGELRPSYKGSQFNLADKTLYKVVADIVDLSPTEFTKEIHKHGDIGTLLSQQSWHGSQDLTLRQVYRKLEELQKISGAGSQEERIAFLKHFFKELTPVGAGFVARIIIGKLRTGFSDMTMIDAFSWMLVGNKSLRTDIEHAYNICADLGLIAYTLKKDGISGLQSLHMQPGIPVLPSLAERLPTAHAIVEKLGHCAAQPKLDGFRLQVHKDAEKIHFFSRNLQDMSHMFPELTAAAHKLPVKSVIMEGEAIVFDESTGAFLPFQETVKRKRKHDIAETAQDFPLKLFIFDILYLDGKPVIQEGHEARRKLLTRILPSDHTKTISLIDEREVTTGQQLEDYFLECLEEGLEGLVVKKMNAHYQTGKRNFNWIKLKRTEESGTLMDSIDAVILGYYRGRGRRAGFGIGAFLIGVYNSTKDTFETIAKVGTGLSDEGWKDIKQKCDNLIVDHKPYNVTVAKELTPDVWVQPKLVWAVVADEITKSPLHTAGKTEHDLGFALRFPRAVQFREDKSQNEATTVAEIKRMYSASHK